jgi:predicted permease
MPTGFAFPRGAELPPGLQFGARTELWTPMRFEESDRRNYATNNLSAIARLRPGASASDFRNASRAQIKQFLAVNAPKLDLSYNFNDLRTQAGQHVRRGLYLLLASVALLLVIASVNVANLLIARTSSREREFAVRAALGAGRVRIARQLVTENLLLGVVGTVLGVAAAAWGTREILAHVPGSLPRADDIGLDWRVLGVSAAVALTLAAVLGLAAASQVSWGTIAGTLQQAGARSTGGRSRRLGRRMLVAAEVALSLMLLVGAALLTKSFMRIQQVNPGFNAPRTLVAGVSIPITRFDFAKDGSAWGRFFGQLVGNLANAPGVEAVGAVSALPLTGSAEGGGTAIVGQTPSDPSLALHAEYFVIEGDYFKAMGIPLLAGRTFAPTDVMDGEHVLIVNREYARKYLGKDVIGRRITTYFDFTRTTPRTIVGMVDNVQSGALDAPAAPQAYVPEAQMTYPSLGIVMRAKGDPLALLPVLRKEVSALDGRIAVANPRTMDDVMQDALATRRFSMTLIGVFAACALLLAMVGLYGVIALSVSQRRKELSVRMALGAQPTDIVRLVLREAFGVAALGAVLGVAGALAGSRLVAAMLFDVSATDGLMYVLAAATVIGIALAASWAPAMRARRLDPASMLRTD